AAWSRPLTMTSAPICASPIAVASPMPRVEPVTRAVFPVRSRFMNCSPISFLQLFGRRHDEDVPGCGCPRQPQEKPSRGDHDAFAIGGMGLHPRFAFFPLPVAGFRETH